MNLWDRIVHTLRKWRKRISGIREMRVDGFEIFDFLLMAAFVLYFSTSWFVGPYTAALRTALPLWVWLTFTAGISAITAWGFLEENFLARRWGSALTALFLWILGVASAVSFPHWFIGFLFCFISAGPAWLCSQFAVYRIQDAHRQPEASEPAVMLDTLPADAPVVKMPRRV